MGRSFPSHIYIGFCFSSCKNFSAKAKLLRGLFHFFKFYETRKISLEIRSYL